MFQKWLYWVGWKIFTRNGGKPGMGGWFYNGGMGNFKVSLHSWQRGSNPVNLWRSPPPYIAYSPSLSRTLSNPCPPLPCHLQSLTQLFFLLSCFFGWMGAHITLDVLFYLMIMDLNMSSIGNLVPEGPWCVLCIKARQVYWGLTSNVVFYW